MLWDGGDQCSRDGQDGRLPGKELRGGENMTQAMGDGFLGCWYHL